MCVFSFFVSFCLFGMVCCSVFVFVFAVESVGGALTQLVSHSVGRPLYRCYPRHIEGLGSLKLALSPATKQTLPRTAQILWFQCKS